MKKLIVPLLTLLFSSNYLFSQVINTPLFASFETEADNPFNLSFDSMDGIVSVENNPAATGINMTSKCVVYTANNAQNWWGKIFFTVKPGITIQPASSAHKYFQFYAYSSSNGLRAEIQVKNTIGTELYKGTFTLAEKNKWQRIVIDLGTGIQASDIGQFYIAPDLDGFISGAQYLVDEFTLSDIPGKYYTASDLSDFEDNSTLPFDLNIDGGNLSVTTNTVQTGINNSDKCLKAEYPAGSDWWHKIKLETKSDVMLMPASDDHVYLHFLTYRSNANQMCIEIYDKAGTLIYKKHQTSALINCWDEMILDLTQSEEGLPGIVGQNIGKIWIYPSAGGGPAAEYRFDRFVLSDQKTPVGNLRAVSNMADFESDDLWKNNIVNIMFQTENATADIDDNPLSGSGINTTNKVLKYVRPEGGEWWHSLQLYLNGYLKAGAPNGYLHFMLYNPMNSNFAVVLNDVQGNSEAIDITSTGSEGWNDHVIDLDELNFTNLSSINFRMSTPGTYYIDEIVTNNESTPRSIVTGLGKSEREDVTVYSSNGNLFVTGNDVNIVKIYSLTGILVNEFQISESIGQIALPAGIYIVKTISENGKINSCRVIL